MTPPKNPLTTYLYGGLPEGGDYESFTAMELAAQSIAEAAHCILGSLGKITGRIRDWRDLLVYEKAHLREESGIIHSRVFKYRELGWDWDAPRRMNDLGGEYAPYVARTVESVRRVSPQLRARAGEMRAALEVQEDVPHPIFDTAIACYDVVIALTSAMEHVVIDWPEKKITNPFVNAHLVVTTGTLVDLVANLVEYDW